MRPDAAIGEGAAGSKQKRLSMMIDAKVAADIKTAQGGNRVYLQHLALQTVHGAGVGLTALPSEEDLKLDPPSFRITLARRLRLAIQPEDGPCSRCGGLMDRFGDHALTCPCAGGARGGITPSETTCMTWPGKGGLGPEKEKAGLLPAAMDLGWG